MIRGLLPAMAKLARIAPWIAFGLVFLLALPGPRAALESSMTAQMLLQFPLLGLCGFVLAAELPARWRARVDAWNAYGISGLFAVALISAVLMIPRLLDLAVVAGGRFEVAKWLALLACGAALRLSWRRAGLLVQGFFLGNVLPMTAAVGQLYQDSPLRLCNAYLLGDQVRLGQWLVGISILVGVAWFTLLLLRLTRGPGPEHPWGLGARVDKDVSAVYD